MSVWDILRRFLFYSFKGFIFVPSENNFKQNALLGII